MGFFSRLFGSTKEDQNPFVNFDPLYTDVHSHLLPGIDDGAQTIEDSLEMIRGFKAMGFHKVVTTPHIYNPGYANTPEIIRAKLAEVKSAVAEAGIEIAIEAAAEYFFDDTFIAKVDNEEELLTFGENFILIETTTLTEPVGLIETFKRLQKRGMNPILAHPERYSYLSAGGFKKVQRLYAEGVLLQINVLSLGGFYDEGARRLAEKMIDNDLVHFLGSDCHKMKQQLSYREAMKSKHFKKALELPLMNRML